MTYHAYIGTDSVRGSRGIYHLAVDGDAGTLRVSGTAPAQDSGYLALSPDGRTLYAAMETMFYSGKAAGGAAAYHIEQDGSLRLLNTQQAAGQLTCHISTDGERLYASSYLKGCVSVFPLAPDGSLEPCCKVLQHVGKYGCKPHIHCAKVTADGKYLLAVEVGYHALTLYDRQTLDEVFEIRTKPVRPRQVVCTERFVYLLTEGGMTVDVYAYQPESEEKLRLLQSVSATPEGFRGMGGAGGIRLSPDGRTLFASIRGVDVIAMYDLNPETGLLTTRSVTKVDGSTPRDFNITPDGKYLLVGLQKSDAMSLWRVDYENGTIRLAASGFPLPSPSCVEFWEGSK